MPAPAQNYPGVDQVQDQPTRVALRFLWDKSATIALFTFGPIQGTLSPDTKPQNLGIKDVGFVFYATDFNRRYQWTGSSWQDDPGAPPRFQIAYFLQGRTPEPATGWARCDGRTVTISTAVGNATSIDTPVIPVLAGQPAWIRL